MSDTAQIEISVTPGVLRAYKRAGCLYHLYRAAWKIIVPPGNSGDALIQAPLGIEAAYVGTDFLPLYAAATCDAVPQLTDPATSLSGLVTPLLRLSGGAMVLSETKQGFFVGETVNSDLSVRSGLSLSNRGSYFFGGALTVSRYPGHIAAGSVPEGYIGAYVTGPMAVAVYQGHVILTDDVQSPLLRSQESAAVQTIFANVLPDLQAGNLTVTAADTVTLPSSLATAAVGYRRMRVISSGSLAQTTAGLLTVTLKDGSYNPSFELYVGAVASGQPGVVAEWGGESTVSLLPSQITFSSALTSGSLTFVFDVC